MGLPTEVPLAIDVALPRGTRTPVTAAPVTWHLFDPATFDVGRKALRVAAGSTIGLYNAERCIIDAFRTRAHAGPELAHDALKRWLLQRGSSPASLLKSALTPLRRALEILL